jgi:hypothetical protein
MPVVGYRIEVSIEGLAWEVVNVTGTLSTNLTAFSAQGTYSIRVQAVNAVGSSHPSTTVDVSVGQQPGWWYSTPALVVWASAAIAVVVVTSLAVRRRKARPPSAAGEVGPEPGAVAEETPPSRGG